MRIAIVAALLTLVVSAASSGDEAKTFRSEFQKAQAAAAASDAPGYLAYMRSAMELEHDRGGRPFYQYNLARAYAMNGNVDASLAALEQAWNERVEGPMIVLADLDPAFASIRSDRRYERIRALFDHLRIDVAHVGGNVYELTGAGCVIAASIGPDGVLLVDSGYPRTTKSVLAAVRELTKAEPRVRYIVNTHGHYDHAAANRDLGQNAIIVAHPAAAETMSGESEFVPGFSIPAVAPAARPDVMTDASLTIPFNGETVRVIALPAHSGGDVVVWFERSHVLHMGDDYFGAESTRLYPGKNPGQYFETLGRLLASVPDDATVISGHASQVPASKLKTAFESSRGTFEYVRSALAAGKEPDAVIREGETAGHPRIWLERFVRLLNQKP